ncbi:PLD nuclease N-terminal domain-containing protein [Dictyobacter aurantiacus]|uniref:Cardiolipin synthase N-terminal domain-containing protein n=1 Tax=Dictyobacter aurantiacus TaxID=1936993 RepID=A0A401ZEK1_9CHLR|nr:PLD nuclease N-terminal domain-containing protein [Dictyobacter aurantiacus]GCE05304.1 hypothetical protein KDAU_26330 [Dictyobacter aurantiacus]
MGSIAMFIILAIYCSIGIVVLLGSVFWIWMIIDCIKYERPDSNDKIIWVLVILFTHLVGAIIYFFMRRQPRIRQGQPYNLP